MRGKLEGVQRIRASVRLIPAHAGKTERLGFRYIDFWAHPRACGENRPSASLERIRAGSSPRMRGKRGNSVRLSPAFGLIPAHAGKTLPGAQRSRSGRAHPRACGENIKTLRQTGACGGSSPRMRGKLFYSWSTIEDHVAHPRACGENLIIPDTHATYNGSSPRMRGKRVLVDAHARATGLIPAHAGKTAYSRSGSMMMTAHPRACGENGKNALLEMRELGSSPRMRGKLSLFDPNIPNVGLIPAHAGKTPVFRKYRITPWAHPRACGENDQCTSVRRLAPGSSPRMRGKLTIHPNYAVTDGLIPAHAGKTPDIPLVGTSTTAHPRACGENCSAELF